MKSPCGAARMHRRICDLGVLALAGVTLGGCKGPTLPDPPLTALYLVSVNGEALPATVVSWPDHQLEFLADTVRFHRGDRWGRERTERFTGFVGVPEIRVLAEGGIPIFEEDRIVLSPGCLPEADRLPAQILIPAGEGYTMEWWVTADVSVVLRYRVLEND